MPISPKTAWLVRWYLSNKIDFQEIFGEILIRNKLTIFLRLFFQYVIISKVIFKTIIGPNDTSQGNLQAWKGYCKTHNLCVCLYIAYIAKGSASLYIKTLYFFICTLALSAAATVASIKIRYDAKTPQFAIFGTCVICVFYSEWYLF